MVDPSERCPACDNEGRSLHGEKNGFRIYRCHGCGTLYPERSRLNYNGYYDESKFSVPDFVDDPLDEVCKGLQAYRKMNRILDIGCGAGALLRAARRAGWHAGGLGVSGPAAQRLRSQGLESFVGGRASAH